MLWLHVALMDVRAFRNGFCVDGVTPLPKTVSFPWDVQVEAAVGVMACTMYVFIDCPSPGILADPTLRNPILFKLVSYLSLTGRVQALQIRDSIQEVAMAATVLLEQPHLIEEPVSFAGLLKRYRQSLAESKLPPPKPRGGEAAPTA